MSDKIKTDTRFFHDLDGRRRGLAHLHERFVVRDYVSFHTPLAQPDDQAVHVALDNGRILSAHQNEVIPERISAMIVRADENRAPVPGHDKSGAVSNVDGRWTKPRVRRARAASHLALIGPEPWQGEDKIRHVSFSRSEADQFFLHAGKQERIVLDGRVAHSDLRIFEYQAAGQACGADYSVRSSSTDPADRITEGRHWITVPDGLPLGMVRRRLSSYLSFLSLHADQRVAPRSAETGKTADGSQHPDLVTYWPAGRSGGETRSAWKAPFAAPGDEDREALANGLSCRAERYSSREKANLCTMTRLGIGRGHHERKAA